MNPELARIIKMLPNARPHLMRCTFGVWLCMGGGVITQAATRKEANDKWVMLNQRVNPLCTRW